PTGVRAERVAELSALVDRLMRVMDPDYIPVWLTKPIETLDDEKPLDLIARGDCRRVLRCCVISNIPAPSSDRAVRRRPDASGPFSSRVDPPDKRSQRGPVVDAIHLADSEDSAAEGARAVASAAAYV